MMSCPDYRTIRLFISEPLDAKHTTVFSITLKLSPNGLYTDTL